MTARSIARGHIAGSLVLLHLSHEVRILQSTATALPSSTESLFVKRSMCIITQPIDDVTLRKLEKIQSAIPQATVSEARRFLKARDGDTEAASIKLKEYLDWRSEFGLDQIPAMDLTNPLSLDEGAWVVSALKSLSLSNPSSFRGEEEKKESWKEMKSLPRLARFDGQDEITPLLDIGGRRILHVMPAQLDDTLASASNYASCVAMYLDQMLDRFAMEKVTVVIDVRGGTGWANPKPQAVIPFVRTVSKLLADLFPERLYQCLVFPMPRAASFIWSIVKVFLDPDTAHKIQIVSGPAANNSLVPPSMQKFIDKDTLQVMERNRLSSFRTN